jgi:hypothetical protein
MSNIKNTVFEVQTTGQEYTIPGDFTADQIVASYAASISGLGNMQATVREEGETRTITFSPRTGTKG